jgi:hypothetical protein
MGVEVETLRGKDKSTKRRLDTWLGTLVYHSAQGEADIGVFGQRLEEIVAPIAPAEAIQEVAQKAAQILQTVEGASLKDCLLGACTPVKMAGHIQLAQDTMTWHPVLNEDEGCQTVGDLVRYWATLTGQDPGDFEMRVNPRLEVLVWDLWRQADNVGLTDEAVLQHPQEAAEFMAGLLNLLFEETPPAKLVEAAATGMGAVADASIVDLKNGLRELLGQASEFTAWRASQQIGVTLESNPEVRQALSTSEVAALVEYEEQRQGWGGDADKAVKVLECNLGSELGQPSGGWAAKSGLLSALQSVARRSLTGNLKEAIRGGLRGRIVELARGWLDKQGMHKAVAMRYEEESEGNEHRSTWSKIFEILTGGQRQ